MTLLAQHDPLAWYNQPEWYPAGEVSVFPAGEGSIDASASVLQLCIKLFVWQSLFIW
jgi:hypothetical protein